MGNAAPCPAPPRQRRLAVRCLRSLGVFLVFWLVLAYLILPSWWRRTTRGTAVADAPRFTRTKDGVPGDPLNLAVVATEEELVRAMDRAGWCPADKVTLRTSARIVVASLFHRSYETAPVSDLFLFGRRQDLAFQQPVGHDPRKRHHVRFWQSADVDESGRPVWLGAATYDAKIGISHTTGQITHHIAPDIDTERDHVLADLGKAGLLAEVEWQDGFHVRRVGHNGGGDRYYTDRRLAIAVLPFGDSAE